MFNLVNMLPAEDKEKITKYVELWGAAEHFIGVDKWLADWGMSKIKLYKLLGNSFIYKAPFKYEKTKEELKTQLYTLMDNDPFIDKYFQWLNHFMINDKIDTFTASKLKDVVSIPCFVDDTIVQGVKYKCENASRELQLQKGTKPMRALSRVLEYWKDEPEVIDMMADFENFRIEHSKILNDKIVKGNICISIHPLDFMTMSDNASNWDSCMNWQNQGCYRVGTIEMMNSNNVVCCYLESKDHFYFNQQTTRRKPSEDPDDSCEWNNKRWRQLFYITKDIIVSGKPYPYTNSKLTQHILSTLRELARKNLKWTYSFGPERYYDMKYINSSLSMRRVQSHIKYKDMKKHNIIFHTKGMYNDMLNDNNTQYWCVRNKVNHNKVITYSGKCPCLCCGESIIEYDDENDHYYNERYINVNGVICQNCRDNLFHCAVCCNENSRIKHYTYINEEQEVVQMCETCWKEKVKECPCCGNPILAGTYIRSRLFAPKRRAYNKQEVLNHYLKWDYETKTYQTQDSLFNTLIPVFVCKDCATALGAKPDQYADSTFSWDTTHFKVLPYKEDFSEYEKFMYKNLKPVPFPAPYDDHLLTVKSMWENQD